MSDPEIDAMAAIAKAFDQLDDVEARSRVIRWAASKYGTPAPAFSEITDASCAVATQDVLLPIGPNARRWLERNDIAADSLLDVFHFEDGKVDFIAGSLPGASATEKTKNAYLIAAIMSALQTDQFSIDDKRARELCAEHGCYDMNNHSAYLKGLNGSMLGSKGSGYRLTNPGQQLAAKAVLALVGAKS